MISQDISHFGLKSMDYHLKHSSLLHFSVTSFLTKNSVRFPWTDRLSLLIVRKIKALLEQPE